MRRTILAVALACAGCAASGGRGPVNPPAVVDKTPWLSFWFRYPFAGNWSFQTSMDETNWQTLTNFPAPASTSNAVPWTVKPLVPGATYRLQYLP